MTAAKVMSFPAHCPRAFFRGFSRFILCSFWWIAPGFLGFSQNNPAPEQKPNVVVKANLADVLISFEGEIDWQKYVMPAMKEDKGLFVFQKLREQASISQRMTRQFLEERSIPYTSYCVSNVIHARIPAEFFGQLAQLDHVRQISANSPFTQEDVFVDETPVINRSAQPEWGILNIKANQVWDLGYTGQGVVVGGEDTGFDWDHPALKASYRGTIGDTAEHAYNWHDAIHEISPLHGDSIIDPSNNPCGLNSLIPCDDNGHGTHTMGTMVGLDGENQIGVAPGATWIACRNMERGWGSPATYLECMEWFLAPTDENGENPDPTKSPHVINNSWSCPEIEGCNPDNFELLRQAVINLRAAGIVVVVSAGNSGSGCESVSAPLAIFEESFTVGAINMNDTIAGFSSRGPVAVDSSMRTKPNISAPGVQVRSSWLGDIYISINGTSMAGPHVAGVVALMISANPQLAGQVEVIENILEATARPKTTMQDCGNISGVDPLNNTFGYGNVDALAAVEAALLISSVEDEIAPLRNIPFKVFPNPVSERLYVTSDEIDVILSLRVIAADGREVYQVRGLALPAQLDMQKYPQGLYFVQLDSHTPVIIQVSK